MAYRMPDGGDAIFVGLCPDTVDLRVGCSQDGAKILAKFGGEDGNLFAVFLSDDDFVTLVGVMTYPGHKDVAMLVCCYCGVVAKGFAIGQKSP